MLWIRRSEGGQQENECEEKDEQKAEHADFSCCSNFVSCLRDCSGNSAGRPGAGDGFFQNQSGSVPEISVRYGLDGEGYVYADVCRVIPEHPDRRSDRCGECGRGPAARNCRGCAGKEGGCGDFLGDRSCDGYPAHSSGDADFNCLRQRICRYCGGSIPEPLAFPGAGDPGRGDPAERGTLYNGGRETWSVKTGECAAAYDPAPSAPVPHGNNPFISPCNPS